MYEEQREAYPLNQLVICSTQVHSCGELKVPSWSALHEGLTLPRSCMAATAKLAYCQIRAGPSLCDPTRPWTHRALLEELHDTSLIHNELVPGDRLQPGKHNIKQFDMVPINETRIQNHMHKQINGRKMQECEASSDSSSLFYYPMYLKCVSMLHKAGQ